MNKLSEGKVRLLVREATSTEKVIVNALLDASTEVCTWLVQSGCTCAACHRANSADFSCLQPKLAQANKIQVGLPKVDGSKTKMVSYLITVKAPEDAAALIKVINENKPAKK